VRLLVIGCGNDDRGDDAAGLLVARRLRELGIEALAHSRDGLALIESWAGAERVILIDSVVTGYPPGTIGEWDARAAPVLRDALRASSHAFGVAEAIDLARVLGRLPPEMKIYGIEGASFEAGAGPGAEVLGAVERLAGRIADEIRGAKGTGQ
jgi:hydrogenase maturation protease